MDLMAAPDPTSDPFLHHYALLEHVHRRMRPGTYVEIGVDAGLSLRFAHPGTTVVGIDPVLSDEVVAANPHAQLIAATSDDFFADHDLRALLGGRPVDLAFVDGMHHFEYVLRDLANLQRHCHEDTVVLIHDCLPTGRACAARERTTVAWAGDVWRAAHALVIEWPDVGFITLDVAPTGMGLLTGLDGAEPLVEHLDDWTRRYRAVDYTVFDRDPTAAVNQRPATPELVDRLLPAARA
jgi:predicted O-methyltransferase YrrM